MASSSQIESLKELLEDIVLPKNRAAFSVNPEHITMLYGTKIKKQFSRKRKLKKSSTLSRKENFKLGLYTLPTKKMTYAEALPLHRLWKGYIKEHLSLRNGDNIPQIYDPGYDTFQKLLCKTDLHGAKITVKKSKCSTFVGISGIVIMDTKNVLKILGEDNCLRTIPKKECLFEMKIGSMSVVIVGKHFNIRPVERAVKKIKSCIEPELWMVE